MASTTVIDEKLKVYSSVQSDIQTLLSQRQQLLSQLNENTMVKGELDLLEEDGKVYKLVGPVLMSVDLNESKANVEKRLQLIEGELKKIDSNIDNRQKELKTIGDEVAKMQQDLQAEAAKAAKQVAGVV
eukprot:gene38064-46248_t